MTIRLVGSTIIILDKLQKKKGHKSTDVQNSLYSVYFLSSQCFYTGPLPPSVSPLCPYAGSSAPV